MKFFIVLAFIVASASAQAIVAGIANTGASAVSRSEDGLGNYAFGYNEDHAFGGTFRKEKGGPGVQVGSYGLKEADGRMRVVNYVADALGFRASVSTNEPGTDSKQDPAAVSMNTGHIAAPVAIAAPSIASVAMTHTPVVAKAFDASPFIAKTYDARVMASPLVKAWDSPLIAKAYDSWGSPYLAKAYDTDIMGKAVFDARGLVDARGLIAAKTFGGPVAIAAAPITAHRYDVATQHITSPLIAKAAFATPYGKFF